MKQNRLGTSEIMVSEVGFGCMSLNASDVPESVAMVQEAFSNGVTFFDTADLYDQGRNEEIVGQALQGCRHDVVIATKVGNRFVPGENGWTWDPSPDYIESAIEASLRRLKTDYVDLYQLHGGTMEDPFDGIVEAMERLKERGWIREYGISSIRPNVILRYLEHANIASVMMQYSLLDRRPEEWFDAISSAGVSVIARGPVARGLLTGAKRLADGETYLDWTKSEIDHTVTAIHSCVRDGRTAAQVSLAYALHPEVVATAVPGASSRQQLTDNVGAADIQLTKAELSRLRNALPPAKYNAHRP